MPDKAAYLNKQKRKAIAATADKTSATPFMGTGLNLQMKMLALAMMTQPRFSKRSQPFEGKIKINKEYSSIKKRMRKMRRHGNLSNE